MSVKRRNLTKAVVTRDLTAAASPTNCQHVLIMKSSPQGSSCRQVSYRVKVQRVTLIGPAKD